VYQEKSIILSKGKTNLQATFEKGKSVKKARSNLTHHRDATAGSVKSVNKCRSGKKETYHDKESLSKVFVFCDREKALLGGGKQAENTKPREDHWRTKSTAHVIVSSSYKQKREGCTLASP